MSANQPATRYARSEGAHIAYQVIGTGEPLVFMAGLSTHVEAMWDEPGLARFLHRLATFSQLILFDKRGAGLSDPLGEAATLEAHVQDALAVLDTVGAEAANFVAANEASLIAIPLAATFPHRVKRLVIINGTARLLRADDYPIGVEWSDATDYVQKLSATYGEERSGIALSAPTMLDDQSFVEWAKRYLRLASSPGSFDRTTRLVGATDVRAILPTIGCPTLVFHRRDNRFTPVDHGQFIADHIDGADYVELDGADHLPWVGPGTDRILDDTERLVTGSEPSPTSNRLLATLVFTDIVGSTERLGRLGDREWASLAGAHDDAVRSVVERFGGTVVDTAGDGVFAMFDGPSRGLEAAVMILHKTTGLGLNVRAGVHTGEVEVSGGSVRGMAVHTAARVMAQAEDGGIVASRIVRDLVTGSSFRFEPLGSRSLKGISEPIELFSVAGA